MHPRRLCRLRFDDRDTPVGDRADARCAWTSTPLHRPPGLLGHTHTGCDRYCDRCHANDQNNAPQRQLFLNKSHLAPPLFDRFDRFEKGLDVRLFGLQPFGVGHAYCDTDPAGSGFEEDDLGIEHLRLSVLHFHCPGVLRVLGFHSIDLTDVRRFRFFGIGDQRSCRGLDIFIGLVDCLHIFNDPNAEPNQSVRCGAGDALGSRILGFGLDSNFHPSGMRTVNSGVSLRL